MKTSHFNHRIAALAGLLMSAVITGCHHEPIAHGERFYNGEEPTCTGKMAQAQAAAGAKDDGMLYDKNFHGAELNSLGQGKLDLIVKGTPDGDPVFIYLDMPHDQVALRQVAVTAFLKAHGIPDSKIIVAEGPNLNPVTPTAYNINGLYKSDGTSFNGQAAADSTTGGAPGGMASGGSH